MIELTAVLKIDWDLRYASSKLTATQLGTAMKIQAWVGGVAPDADTGLNFKTKDIVKKYY